MIKNDFQQWQQSLSNRKQQWGVTTTKLIEYDDDDDKGTAGKISSSILITLKLYLFIKGIAILNRA